MTVCQKCTSPNVSVGKKTGGVSIDVLMGPIFLGVGTTFGAVVGALVGALAGAVVGGISSDWESIIITGAGTTAIGVVIGGLLGRRSAVAVTGSSLDDVYICRDCKHIFD